MLPLGGISSVGRALAWHARGQEFDSPMLHQTFFGSLLLFLSFRKTKLEIIA
jgi:hypothetical protein